MNEILFTTCLLQIFKLLQSIFCSKFFNQIPFLPSAGFISVNMRVVNFAVLREIGTSLFSKFLDINSFCAIFVM